MTDVAEEGIVEEEVVEEVTEEERRTTITLG